MLAVNIFEQNFNLIEENFGLTTGLGIEWNNYRLNDNVSGLTSMMTMDNLAGLCIMMKNQLH
jgi:hypothetical protein